MSRVPWNFGGGPVMLMRLRAHHHKRAVRSYRPVRRRDHHDQLGKLTEADNYAQQCTMMAGQTHFAYRNKQGQTAAHAQIWPRFIRLDPMWDQSCFVSEFSIWTPYR
jgi:hypothetical protein